ncbi:MAG: arylsulfatase [Bacillota bacterium]|nr:arylsulfatase [Bacillota bacterium]
MLKKPNIVLIIADQMRGDCIGALGHPDVKTPHLDSLIQMGTCFNNAYSSCPTCVPARAILHTGLGQRRTGRIGYRDRVDWDYPVTMAGEMSKAGYYTQCVGKMHVHPLRNYLGYHHVKLHDGYLHQYRYPSLAYCEDQRVADDYFYWLKDELGISADVTDTGLDCNSWVARPWIYEEKHHPTNWVTSEGLDFLRRRDPRQPFFLTLSYVRPHPPLDAPQAYFDMYKDKDLTPPKTGDWNDLAALEKEGLHYSNITGAKDPELIRAMQAGYYACISHLDNQIGRFLQGLVEHRLMEDTVILFTADHGEMLGDHRCTQKSRPYQGSVHIPLIISGDPKWTGLQHGIREDLAELRDIMPTCLDLAGTEAPNLDGQSLLKPVDRTKLHCEHEYGSKSFQMILTGVDKFIWYSQTGEEQYFDLKADPDETRNAIGDAAYRQRIQELRQELIKTLQGCEEGYSDGERLIAGKPAQRLLKSVFPDQ